MLDLLGRNFRETALKIAGLAEQQAREFTFAGEHGWDIDALPGGDTKASSRPREPAQIDLIVVHVTDVRGGFGVMKSKVRKWMSGEYTMPQEIADQNDKIEPYVVNNRRLALWSRYRYVPYHQIAAQNGDAIANRRLSQRSYHGNTGNGGVGFAVDCRHNEQLDDFLALTGRAALRALILRLRKAGNEKILRVAPHRSFSSGRRNDPGPIVWTRVVKPVVDSTDNVRIDYEIANNKGRPVPRTWDMDATHDDRGRRL